MKKTLYPVLFLIITAVSGMLLAQNKNIILSVTPFNENTMHVEGMGSSLAAETGETFKDLSGFAIKNVEEIKDFLALIERVQLGDATIPAGAQMKKIAEADYVVVGSVSAFDAGRQIEADMRLVLPDGGRIVFSAGSSAASAESASDSIESLIKKNADTAKIRAREKNTPDDASLGLKERLNVAVGVFTDSNIESQETGLAAPFADILNAALAGFDSITAIDRINTVKLASEKEFTMLDVTYFSPAVRSREFKARDIEYVVSGEIFVYNGLTAISYRVETADNGTVIFSGQQEIATTKGLRPAAYSIAKSIEEGLVKTSGFLRVTSEPNGAMVTVDGELRGTTPLQVTLPKGAHQVSITQESYDTIERSVTIEPRKTAAINEKLKAIDIELLTKADAEESNQNWTKAISIYKELISRYPKTEASHTARYRIGWIYQFKLSQSDQAKAYFSELLSMYPGEYIRTEAYYGLANIYETTGDKAAAQRLYSMLIKEYPQAVATEEAKKRLSVMK